MLEAEIMQIGKTLNFHQFGIVAAANFPSRCSSCIVFICQRCCKSRAAIGERGLSRPRNSHRIRTYRTLLLVKSRYSRECWFCVVLSPENKGTKRTSPRERKGRYLLMKRPSPRERKGGYRVTQKAMREARMVEWCSSFSISLS